jgi:hypothetical protein
LPTRHCLLAAERTELDAHQDLIYVDGPGMIFNIECEREADGRWLAEVPELPGVLAYGHL